MRGKRCLGVGWLILLSLSQYTFAGSSNLKLDVALSKDIYLLNEPIWLDASLTNVSTDTVRTGWMRPELHNGYFDIELVDNIGTAYEYTGDKWHVINGGHGALLLQSKETFYICVNVLETNGESKGGLHNSWFLKFLPTGTYKIRASHSGIWSEQLAFEVVQPQGEEKQAHKDMLKAYLSDLDVYLNLSDLEQFVQRYPNSIYYEKVCWDLPDDTGFFRKFPNSGYNESNLRSLTGSMTPEEKKAFLQKVATDYPDTRSAKFAQQMLKSQEE